MIYKNFQGLRLSALGMGAMRLPVLDGSYGRIDEAATAEMIDHMMKQGINYFDTAWGYHEGNSEAVMGKLLSGYPREEFYLASKFPGYELSNMDKVEVIFEKQLENCRVEYFDFYMFHNVCEMNIDAYLDEKYGIFNYLKKQKDSGRIRNLGFSAHGSYDVIKRFLNAYGEYMEFCQIQINFLDWTFQGAKEKAALLNEYNIPVWAMEPLRGGKLASLSEDNEAKLKALRPNEEIPAWAFRFLQTIPNVTVILSGMSDMRQLQDNLHTFESEKPLMPQELDTLLGIAEDIVKGIALPCTACRYCVKSCPQKLNIPELIGLYNEHCFTTSTGAASFIAPMVLSTMPEDKRPEVCIGCRECEAVCPQNIKISEAMTDFRTKLNA